MGEITIKYSFCNKSNGDSINAKVLDDNLVEITTSYHLLDIGESLLHSTVAKICFDFSNLKFINSSCLGVFMNLTEKAKNMSKIIKFRVSPDVMALIELTNIDRIISVES